jgi:hypothetical protein
MSESITCLNCTKPAHFVYQITHTVGQAYCNTHLPSFLNARKKAGLLKTTEEWAELTAESLKILSKDPSKEPAVDPATDAPADAPEETEEETTSETSQKRTPPKKSV